jgi:hypothetical protein
LVIGRDTFAWLELDAGRDIIRDYNADQGDQLGIRALLEGFDPATSSIADFVRLEPAGGPGNVRVFVDVDGAGGPAGFARLVTLWNPLLLDGDGVLIANPESGDGLAGGAGPCDDGTFQFGDPLVVRLPGSQNALAANQVLDDDPGVPSVSGGAAATPSQAGPAPVADCGCEGGAAAAMAAVTQLAAVPEQVDAPTG